MPSNSVVIAALQADPIPPERECLLNGSDVAQLIVDFIKVTGLASASAGTPFPAGNNVAQQALQTAQDALAIAQTVQGQIKQSRSSGAKIPVPAGDSIFTCSWSPALNTTNYEVRVAIFGPATHPAAYYGWRVQDGTQQATNVTIVLDNIPAGCSIVWVVQEI